MNVNVSQEDNVGNVVGILVVVVFVVVKVNLSVNRIASMEETKNAIHERVLLPHHPYTLTLPQSAPTPFISLSLSLYFLPSLLFLILYFGFISVVFLLFWNFLRLRKTWQENLDVVFSTLTSIYLSIIIIIKLLEKRKNTNSYPNKLPS